jgi:hypothetical protein
MNCIVPYSYRLMKIFMIVLFVTFFLLTISTTYIYVHSENSTITTERGDVECTCLNADSISAYSFILRTKSGHHIPLDKMISTNVSNLKLFRDRVDNLECKIDLLHKSFDETNKAISITSSVVKKNSNDINDIFNNV